MCSTIHCTVQGDMPSAVVKEHHDMYQGMMILNMPWYMSECVPPHLLMQCQTPCVIEHPDAPSHMVTGYCIEWWENTLYPYLASVATDAGNG